VLQRHSPIEEKKTVMQIVQNADSPLADELNTCTPARTRSSSALRQTDLMRNLRSDAANKSRHVMTVRRTFCDSGKALAHLASLTITCHGPF
jgi:hypothetical protein